MTKDKQSANNALQACMMQPSFTDFFNKNHARIIHLFKKKHKNILIREYYIHVVTINYIQLKRTCYIDVENSKF